MPPSPRCAAFSTTNSIVELAMEMAIYNAVVRVLVPLGVELEPGLTKA